MPNGNANPQLPSIPGGWYEARIPLGTRHVRLAVPRDPDALLDSIVAGRTGDVDEASPYWSLVWPAALKMAGLVHRLPIKKDSPVLEVGCGLGLVGIAGLLCGLPMVMSDFREEPILAARWNAALSGFHQARVLHVDWREPAAERFDTIIACDVLYDPTSHDHILGFAESAVASEGTCWIGDPGRDQALDFVESAQKRFRVSVFDENLEPIPSPRHGVFSLIQLQLP